MLSGTALPGPGPRGGSGDTSAPSISGLTLTNRVFRVGRAPRGTTFRLRLSEPAAVHFTIEKRTPGRRVGDSCRRITRGNRSRRRCIRYVPLSRFTRVGQAGANSFRFSGRIKRKGRGRALIPGRYRASLVARDAARNRSKTARVGFRVVP